MAFIDVKNFSKSFGKTQVIFDLSFQVEKGEVFAFLGANGSGKTTTIRSLLGIYLPDAGELTIDGRVYDSSMSPMIGYLPEERGLYLESNPVDVLAFFGKLKGLAAPEAKRRAQEYLERVDLADHAKQKIKSLSSGQQQKIQLGVTMINQPSLLILDEPTKGLDPVNRQLLMDMLEEMNDQHGTTILFSTHIMDEAEKIADRLLMIKDGRKSLYGATDEVRRSFGENSVQLEHSGKLEPNEKLFQITSQERNYAELKLAEGVEGNDVVKALMAQGIKISRFAISAPSLQEIFIEVSNAKPKK